MAPRFTARLASLLLLAVVFLPLAGCSDDDEGPTNPVVTPSGVFLDGAVQGLEYTGGTKTGTTDAAGTFQYDTGSNVTFRIGDIVLGTGAGAAILTPVELVPGAVDELDPTVTNLTRFLLTVDDDANAANGILITSAIRDAADGTPIDFAQSTSEFESDPAVTDAVDALTSAGTAGTRTLVDAATAQAHLAETRAGVLSANYSGEVHDVHTEGPVVNHGEIGTFTFTVGEDGTLTGTATIETVQYAMSGQVESSGAFLGSSVEPAYEFEGTIELDGTVDALWHGPGKLHAQLLGARSPNP
ncbi:MAG: hypothetical protein ACREOU_07040 [Candidatus Eiseniibacteriota bacterium]